MTKMRSKFYITCQECQHELKVVVKGATKGTMLIFDCSKCKATNILNTAEILKQQH
ncbi:MAG: hypothetical protein HFJ42_01270 [Clostridia bacterium]|nr:hypothetical protein [Clostridia bacterium]